MPKTHRACFAIVLAALLGPLALASRPGIDTDDELTQQLRRALAVHSDKPLSGRQLDLLAALRNLRDDRLRLLFADMASSTERELRNQGLLALGEISEDGKISLGMIGEIKDPAEQAALVLRAMAGKLLDEAQIKSILTWPKLDPRLEIALRSRLAVGGQPPDPARLRELTSSADTGAAIGAYVLLLQTGDTEAAGGAMTKLTALDDNRRGAVLSQVLELIRRDKIPQAAPLLNSIAEMHALAPEERDEVMLTLLRIAPEAGRAAWLKSWNGTSEITGRIRLGLVALGASDVCDDKVAAALTSISDEPVLVGMGKSLGAIAGRDWPAASKAMLDLLDQNHPLTAAWIVTKARDLPDGQDKVVLEGLIDHFGTGRRPRDPVNKIFYEAAWRLGERDPAALGARLAAACKAEDDPQVEALLAAAMRACTTPLWDPAAPPTFPTRTAQAMAVLFEARLNGIKPGTEVQPGTAPRTSGGGFPNDPAKAQRLREIGLGWGNLPDIYRSLAAWLALCQDGKDREALARVLAPDAGD